MLLGWLTAAIGVFVLWGLRMVENITSFETPFLRCWRNYAGRPV
jgi:hypothetical protein